MYTHPATNAATSKPFLKWTGGKSRVLPKLLPLLPSGSRLIEPFVGAGSVFLGTDYDLFIINDANSDLAATWAALKSRPSEYIARAAELFTEGHRNQAAYLRIRAEFNATTDRFERAVRLPYLNRFGFNGLFRVNRKGGFNVPYGAPVSLPVFDVQRYEAAAAKLGRCQVLNGGYAEAIELAGVGDVVYCDPPYLDSTTGASFTGYTANGFSMADHEQLVECCVRAASRGAKVMVSNHDTPEARALFEGWRIEVFPVRRSISAKAGSRGNAMELVAVLR